MFGATSLRADALSADLRREEFEAGHRTVVPVPGKSLNLH
jgi:hypothetical protein